MLRDINVIRSEVEFPEPEASTSVYRWFYRFHKWLEERARQALIRIEPVDPEPEPVEEPADFYEEVGY